MERLRHLPIKTSPSHQGARPDGVTCRSGRPRVKKKAARRYIGHKKVLQRSLLRLVPTTLLLQHVKTPHCTQLRCTGTHRTEPFVL